MIDVILQAFASIVLDPVTLGLMFVGTLAGILAGAIPGFTIAMGVILTLPFTFGMTAVQGLATMLGVFVGGFSGGLMSCMLTGIPGTPSSVATTFDGFPLVRSGRPGLALGLGLWSSFFGGMISAVILVALAPQLAFLGLEFGPAEITGVSATASVGSISPADVVGLSSVSATASVGSITPADIVMGKKAIAGGLSYFAQLCGYTLALAHCRGDRRSTRFAQKAYPIIAQHKESLINLAKRHVEQVLYDHSLFTELCKNEVTPFNKCTN